MSDEKTVGQGQFRLTRLGSAGDVSLNIPKLRRLTFETAIIKRYLRRESSVEEALIEMYLAGVSVRSRRRCGALPRLAKANW